MKSLRKGTLPWERGTVCVYAYPKYKFTAAAWKLVFS